MTPHPGVSIVCPTYNEAGIASDTLATLYKVAKKEFPHFEILVLDDASTDGNFAQLARVAHGKSSLRVLSHTKNQGTAITLRKLYTLTKYPLVIIFSLDGEWDTADVVRLYKKQQQEHADMVIGVRQQKQYTIGRKIVSSLYNYLSPLVFGVQTFDAGSIKILKRTLVESIPIVSVGVFDEAERIIRATKQGYTITSIPIAHLPTRKYKRKIPRPDLIVEAVHDMIRVRLAV